MESTWCGRFAVSRLQPALRRPLAPQRILALLSFLILPLLGCNDEPVRSSFVSRPPRIDGDLAEWQDVPVRIFRERNIAVGALHDSDYVYVAARCADEEINRTIRRRGFTMWIDPEAGEKKDLELHYPSSGYESPDPTRGGFWDAMTDEERTRAFDRLGRMRDGVLVIDRRGITSRVFPPDSSAGFAAASAESKGILTVEVRIPLHPEVYFPLYSAISRREKIRIGIAAGPPSDQNLSTRGENMGGPMGFPAGGRMGYGRRGMNPRQQSSSRESALWVDVLLSKGP